MAQQAEEGGDGWGWVEGRELQTLDRTGDRDDSSSSTARSPPTFSTDNPGRSRSTDTHAPPP
eukprot:COSAG01_NODE_57092_length_314_cov_1.181395_1_plen_61_part_01